MHKLQYYPDQNFYGEDILALLANDGSHSSGATVPIFINAVDDAPIVSLPSGDNNNPFTVDEDQETVLTGIAIVDIDIDDRASINVHMQAQHGSFRAGYVQGVELVSDAAGASLGHIHIRGSIQNVNTALEGLLYSPSQHFHGAENITLSVEYGAGRAISQSCVIAVKPVNDRPVISAPAAVDAVKGTLVFIEGVAVSDVDAHHHLGGLLSVTISASHGAVGLDPEAARLAGLRFLGGDDLPAQQLRLRAPIARLNHALASLAYHPPPQFTGVATLELEVSDFNADGTASASIDVQVTQAADFTEIIATQLIRTQEDTPVDLSFTVSDVDVDANSMMEVALAAAEGFVGFRLLDDNTKLTGGGHSQELRTVGSHTTRQDEVQRVKTAGTGNHEVQTLSISGTKEELTQVVPLELSFAHGDVNPRVSLSLNPSSPGTELYVKQQLEALENMGEVLVTRSCTDTVCTFDIKFVGNGGDIPELLVVNDFAFPGSVSVAVVEVIKGTTTAEVQRVSLVSNSTVVSGTFQLEFGQKGSGLSTQQLDYNAEASDIKIALEQLSNVKCVAVSGVSPSWDVTFITAADVPPLRPRWNGGGASVPLSPETAACNTCASFNSGFRFVEVQTVQEGSVLVEGTFTLSYDGRSFEQVHTTLPINANATATEVMLHLLWQF
jgi:hypothetical protein